MREIQDSELTAKQRYFQFLSQDSTNTDSTTKSLFKKARAESDRLNKSGISLSEIEAKLVGHLVRLKACQNFIEIGTLTGYSALFISENQPIGSRLWTIEKDPVHAEIAKGIFAEYNTNQQGQKVIVGLEGDARLVLQNLSEQGPFDGIFIDGNKAAYLDYLIWAEQNLKPGSLVLADNIYLSGAVFDGDKQGQAAKFSDKQVQIMREFNQRIFKSGRYEPCLIDTSEGLISAILK